ncbi:hypothetical protein SAMN04487979_1094 [Flavobacterium sp. ov086]|nr:hypothetical protein SAMN04487979_1094 [Flavobacterium sp. ov086]
MLVNVFINLQSYTENRYFQFKIMTFTQIPQPTTLKSYSK